jgi:hypothetical protein
MPCYKNMFMLDNIVVMLRLICSGNEKSMRTITNNKMISVEKIYILNIIWIIFNSSVKQALTETSKMRRLADLESSSN